MRKSAFTLVELLITIILFSMLLATTLYSFRFMSINIRNINNTNPQKAINYDLLRGAIGSIYYYVEVNEKESNLYKRFYHYFKGTPTECYFITASPIFYRDISLGHIKYEKSKLWYEEGKIFDKSVDYMKLDSIPLTKKMLISDNLESASFAYLSSGKYQKNIQNKIPLLIAIKTIRKSKKRVNMFRIKADNMKHLNSIIDVGAEL